MINLEFATTSEIDRLARYVLTVIGFISPGELADGPDVNFAREAISCRGDVGLAIEDLRYHFSLRSKGETELQTLLAGIRHDFSMRRSDATAKEWIIRIDEWRRQFTGR